MRVVVVREDVVHQGADVVGARLSICVADRPPRSLRFPARGCATATVLVRRDLVVVGVHRISVRGPDVKADAGRLAVALYEVTVEVAPVDGPAVPAAIDARVGLRLPDPVAVDRYMQRIVGVRVTFTVLPGSEALPNAMLTEITAPTATNISSAERMSFLSNRSSSKFRL